MNKQKVIAFDLDDVLCYRKSGVEHLGPKKYEHCVPISKNINLLNSFHQEGYKIVIYTARGMSQFKGDVKRIYDELYDQTASQLDFWGVNYDQLVMGKIHYDVLIDDKALNSKKVTKEKVLEIL